MGDTLYEPMCSGLHKLKKMHRCSHCDAMKFEYEPPGFCCDNGKIKLASTDIPQDLFDLFTSQSEESNFFLKQIRAYNCIFSFTSFGVKLDKGLASGKRGVYTFRVQGQIYHDLPGLMPNENGPEYFQLYFHDTANEFENRMSIISNGSLKEKIVEKLMRILEVNPYAKFFRRLEEYQSINDIQIHITKDIRLDQRVYNSPTTDQVAAIWIEGNNANIPFERDIVVHSHSGQRHKIKHYFGCYDALQYPILFPKGDVGWHQNIPKVNDSNHDTSMQENFSIQEASTSIENILAIE